MSEYKIPNGFNILSIMKNHKQIFRTKVNEYPEIEEFAETIPESIELAIQKVNEIQKRNQEV